MSNRQDDEQQQTGMNVLGGQGMATPNNQQQQQGSQQRSLTSGGASASIASGQPQQAPQQQSQKPKKASSGMFTNIRKYMERNKPGAQKMAGNLQKNVSQQNQNIQQAIGKQKTDFMSRVNQNRQRMEQAAQFGQSAINQAQTQQSMPYLQTQQKQLQDRVGKFGEMKDQNVLAYQEYLKGNQPQQQQSQDYNAAAKAAAEARGQEYNPTGEQLGLSATKEALPAGMTFEEFTKQQLGYGQAQTGLEQAQQAYEGSQQQMLDILSGRQIVDPSKFSIGSWDSRTGRFTGGGQRYYNQRELDKMAQSGYTSTFLNQTKKAVQNELNNLKGSLRTGNLFMGYSEREATPEEKSKLEKLENQLAQIDEYKRNAAMRSQAEKTFTDIQGQLTSSTDQQRLFQNKAKLESELSQLEDKIANAPEELTEADIERFNNLRTGIERFDDVSFNLAEQQRGASEAMKQAKSLDTAQGRRELMRKQFGAKGGYSAGQAALDNLILTGDKEAMGNMIKESQAQAEQTQTMLDEAFKQGRISRDELTRGSKQLRENLQKGVEEAQTAMLKGSKEYRDMMAGMSEQQAILDDPLATAEQKEAAQAEMDKINTDLESFEGNRGLEGRARTGEGTMIKSIQDKLASGQGLSPEEMAVLGITEEDMLIKTPEEMLRNIQINPESFGIQDVATLTDVARAEALARLSGREDTDAFFANEMGIDPEAMKRIQARGTIQDGQDFATSYEELSDFEKKALEGVRGTVKEQQQAVKKLSNDIQTQRSLANRALAERSKEGGGTPHWKYWNHYYVIAKQEEAKARNRLNNIANASNNIASESGSKEQAIQNFLNKYRR